jgi:predicted transcriptional regulator
MQIGNRKEVAGIPMVHVRDFFRHIVAWHRHSFDLSQLQEKLNLEHKPAVALAEALVAGGYIALGENNEYALTDTGEKLIHASASGTIKRSTAELALAGLLERAQKYNADPGKILRVDAVIVFGSFLGTKEQLGDLDIAVKSHFRDEANSTEVREAYSTKSGRQFSNIVDFLYWPETELKQFLKARKRTIRIQEWDSFVRLIEKDSQMRYRVVLGDDATVRTKIMLEVERRRKMRL